MQIHPTDPAGKASVADAVSERWCCSFSPTTPPPPVQLGVLDGAVCDACCLGTAGLHRAAEAEPGVPAACGHRLPAGHGQPAGLHQGGAAREAGLFFLMLACFGDVHMCVCVPENWWWCLCATVWWLFFWDGGGHRSVGSFESYLMCNLTETGQQAADVCSGLCPPLRFCSAARRLRTRSRGGSRDWSRRGCERTCLGASLLPPHLRITTESLMCETGLHVSCASAVPATCCPAAHPPTAAIQVPEA